MDIIYLELVNDLENKLGRTLTKKECKFVKWMVEKDFQKKNIKTTEGFVISTWTCFLMNY